ncbi:hypothetical protein QFC19_001838 [Naganishia cerealis]|uniref:Uncharacterized protein n=1 Tax=Naganishia cerealis TaxID=610337 RepID=A0ACC2WFA4_9TREE|nr:hypothetical protein QFC19_001838 [Naganishia cerealis]
MSRRLDLSKFRGGSDSEEEGGAFAPPRKPPVLLDALKQQTFSHGVRKKTKKEIEKENEERKRVEEEKAAAIAFAEFEEAFNGDGAETAPRGGTSSSRSGSGYPPRGPRSAGAGGFVRAGGDGSGPSVYQPPTRQIPTGPSARGVSTNLRSPSPEPLKSKPKGKRAMDTFLEEIKREQQTREEKFGKVAKSKFYRFTGIKSKRITKSLQSWEKARGSHDLGDPESNLPSGISEESLGMFFAKLGPIGAVKIMWRLSGFVAYMKRKDAEVAVKELDGLDWGGCIIRVGWSKMIRLPIRPIYGECTAVNYVLEARSVKKSRHNVILDKILSQIGPEKEQFITAVAQKVRNHGSKFEEMLRDREGQNEKFAFLRNMDITEVMRSILNDASANPEDADAQADQEKMSQSKRTESNAPVLSSKFKTGGFKKAFVPVGTTSAAATVPATAAAGPTVIDVDLDGEAMEMDDDIDGVAIDSAEGGDFDGEPIDLDGEVIDLDGEAIRE